MGFCPQFLFWDKHVKGSSLTPAAEKLLQLSPCVFLVCCACMQPHCQGSAPGQALRFGAVGSRCHSAGTCWLFPLHSQMGVLSVACGSLRVTQQCPPATQYCRSHRRWPSSFFPQDHQDPSASQMTEAACCLCFGLS